MKYKKAIIAVIFTFVLAILAYKSVYFEKLDAKRQKDLIKSFEPKELVKYFWNNKLNDVLKNAIELKTFDSLLKTNPKFLINKFGKTVGITSNYCFLVKGKSRIDQLNSEKVFIDFKGQAHYSLPIKYLFSNTARDALGYFKVNDFENTMDFNAVSSEINACILKKIIAEKTGILGKGTNIEFTGAIEINTEDLPSEIDIIPFKIDTISK